MKSELHTTKSFRKDYKKLSKSEIADTDVVIKKLLNNENLDVSYNDHDLHGNYYGYKECHVRPDLLLVYKRLETGVCNSGIDFIPGFGAILQAYLNS